MKAYWKCHRQVIHHKPSNADRSPRGCGNGRPWGKIPKRGAGPSPGTRVPAGARDIPGPNAAWSLQNAPATLIDEQRQRVSDALENAQSVNTRRNYAGQYRTFHAWCEREEQSALPAQPEVVAAYAAELVAEGKSMSTVRLAVSAIVDAYRRVGLESPVNAGVWETLRSAPLQAVQKHGRWKSPQMPARYTRGEKALEALEWL